jgi:hypothetical protein
MTNKDLRRIFDILRDHIIQNYGEFASVDYCPSCHEALITSCADRSDCLSLVDNLQRKINGSNEIKKILHYEEVYDEGE